MPYEGGRRLRWRQLTFPSPNATRNSLHKRSGVHHMHELVLDCWCKTDLSHWRKRGSFCSIIVIFDNYCALLKYTQAINFRHVQTSARFSGSLSWLVEFRLLEVLLFNSETQLHSSSCWIWFSWNSHQSQEGTERSRHLQQLLYFKSGIRKGKICISIVLTLLLLARDGNN